MARIDIAVTLLLLLASSGAAAQVKGDFEFRVGVSKRFSSGVSSPVLQPGFGPSVDVGGHVALLPLVRLGIYGGYEWSPQSPYAARHLIRGALQFRLFSPFPERPWRMWLAVGFGPVIAFGPADAAVAAHTGRFFELPVGVGVARQVWGKWHVTGELLARPAFGHGGALFEIRGAGTDALGLGLAIGMQHEW